MLEVRDLSVRLGGRDRVRNVSLRLPPGEVMGIIGPNGAGKSTLIKAVSGERSANRGDVLLDRTALGRLCRKHLARILSVMGQTPSVSFDFTVRELVALARVPHRNTDTPILRRRIVDHAIHLAGLDGYEDRAVPSLSGGERQRAFFAKAVAQLMIRPDALPGPGTLLLLDEPTSALDLAQQMRVMSTVRRIADAGGSVLLVLHDLNLALSFTDRLAVLVDGALAATGPTRDVMSEDGVARWYECPVRVFQDEHGEDRAVVMDRPDRDPLGSRGRLVTSRSTP